MRIENMWRCSSSCRVVAAYTTGTKSCSSSCASSSLSVEIPTESDTVPLAVSTTWNMALPSAKLEAMLLLFPLPSLWYTFPFSGPPVTVNTCFNFRTHARTAMRRGVQARTSLQSEESAAKGPLLRERTFRMVPAKLKKVRSVLASIVGTCRTAQAAPNALTFQRLSTSPAVGLSASCGCGLHTAIDRSRKILESSLNRSDIRTSRSDPDLIGSDRIWRFP